MVDTATEFPRHSDGANWPETDPVLLPLADDLMAIAARLKDVADGAQSAQKLGPPGRGRTTPANHIALARKAYALRRKRAIIFGNPDLFGEPAWDILLDLFIADGEGKSVSVSSACIGSAAPATTGLRWLGVLADQGLIVRENDNEDQRRVLVRLTPAGRAAMTRFFDAVEAGG